MTIQPSHWLIVSCGVTDTEEPRGSVTDARLCSLTVYILLSHHLSSLPHIWCGGNNLIQQILWNCKYLHKPKNDIQSIIFYFVYIGVTSDPEWSPPFFVHSMNRSPPRRQKSDSGYHLSHLTSLSFIITKLPNSAVQSVSFRALLEKLVSMTSRFDGGFLYLIIERGFELKLSNC